MFAAFFAVSASAAAILAFDAATLHEAITSVAGFCKTAMSESVRSENSSLSPFGIAKFNRYFGLPSLSVPSGERETDTSSPGDKVETEPIAICGVLPVKPRKPERSTIKFQPLSPFMYNLALSSSSVLFELMTTRSPVLISSPGYASISATEENSLLMVIASPLV